MNSEPSIKELQELAKLAEGFAGNARDVFEQVIVLEQATKIPKVPVINLTDR